MGNPLVSVVIPTYNRAHIIKRSIMSVLSQTYGNIEIIVIDDGSTDNTEEVVLGINDDRIRYYKKENGGSSSARNMGISLAKGSYIAFQDSDDIWLPYKLEAQMNILLQTIYEVSFCKLLLRKGNGRACELPKRIRAGMVWGKSDLYGVGTQTVILKDYIAKKALFDTAIPRYEYMEWLYRLVRKYNAHFLDMPLVLYSINEDSLSSDYWKMYKGLEAIIKKHPYLKEDSPEMAMHASKDIVTGIFHYLRIRNYKKALKFWKLFWRFYPGLFRYIASRLF